MYYKDYALFLTLAQAVPRGVYVQGYLGTALPSKLAGTCS